MELLKSLFSEIKSKLHNNPEESYSAFLANAGLEKINQKIIEEATEVADASINKNDTETIMEVSDLFFHILVLLAVKNINLEKVLQELDNRRNKKLSKKAIAKNKIKLNL